MMQMVQAAKNPIQYLQQLATENPDVKNVLGYVQQNGGDFKTAFYKMAQEKGIDPNQVLNMLK